MYVYLARHGESESQIKESVMKDKADRELNLTDRGHKQASSLASWVGHHMREESGKAQTKVKVSVSPFTRTEDTFAPTEKELGLKENGGVIDEIVRQEIITERKQGVFAGHNLRERAEKFPEPATKFQANYDRGRLYWAQPPEGESFHDVQKRMDKFIPTLWEDLKNGVTHNFIYGHSRAHSILVKQLTGMTLGEFYDTPVQENCQVRKLELTDDGRVIDHGYVFTPDLERGADNGERKYQTALKEAVDELHENRGEDPKHFAKKNRGEYGFLQRIEATRAAEDPTPRR